MKNWPFKLFIVVVAFAGVGGLFRSGGDRSPHAMPQSPASASGVHAQSAPATGVSASATEAQVGSIPGARITGSLSQRRTVVLNHMAQQTQGILVRERSKLVCTRTTALLADAQQQASKRGVSAQEVLAEKLDIISGEAVKELNRVRAISGDAVSVDGYRNFLFDVEALHQAIAIARQAKPNQFCQTNPQNGLVATQDFSSALWASLNLPDEQSLTQSVQGSEPPSAQEVKP